MFRTALVLLSVLAVVVALLPDAPAAAAEVCEPAGGATLPAHEDVPEGDFQVLGRGWGHGVGMSQHGAQGAARLGCSSTEILETYYPGATVGDVGDVGEEPDRIRVSLFPSAPGGSHATVIRVKAEEGSIPWQLGERDPVTQPEGAWWVVRFASDNGSFTVHRETSDDEEIVLEGNGDERLLRVDMEGDGRMVKLSANNRRYAHGRLEFASDGEQMFVRVAIHGTDEHPAVDRYLWGLAEMPSSWPRAALEAQAITGRAYAVDRWQRFKGGRAGCNCDLYDSASDQVYAGFEKEGEPGFGHDWVDAVNGTSGRVLAHDGALAVGFYSSTHGGQSERIEFSSFFSGSVSLPYLQPVDDSRWELESSSDGNGVLRWAEAFSAERIGQVFGVGAALAVNTPSARGAGGRVGNPDRENGDGERYGGVEIVGTDGTVRVSGLQFVRELGVTRRSELFEVRRGGGVELEECAPTADQTENTTVIRVGGRDRVETATVVSQAHWDRAADVVLARSSDFPDALAAGALAARLGAPVLLTPGDALADLVATELESLEVERVHLLGGEAAIGPDVEDELLAAGYDVVRIAGADRYETAREAALAAGPSESGDVAIALGENWPDAVSAGGLAASSDRVPTLLSRAEVVPEATLDALEELEAGQVLLIGGPAALAETVADQLADAGYEVVRLGGEDRYATSVLAGEEALDRDGPAGDRPVILATGRNFPDALTAGALASRLEASLVLAHPCSLDATEVIRTFVGAGAFDAGVVIGGLQALSDRVREQATEAINGG